MNEIQYRTITTLKETEKSSVVLAAMEGCDDPVIVKRMQNANPEVYRMLSKVDSVHIPHIIAWELQEKVLVVAEEYVDGETLRFHLDKGTFTEEQKLSLALQLCEAVEVLHNCEPQIIHRDIKPSNILVTEDGVLKLIDFDAARQYKKLSDDSDTRILGTADYAAPEQFGYKQTDVRSDIYSMGIVLDGLAVCRTGLAAVFWKRILNVCTNFDPKKRYKSLKTVARDIRRVIALQKYQWGYFFGVLCVGALLLAGGLWLGKSAEEADKPVTGRELTVTPGVTQGVTLTATPTLMLTNTPIPTLSPMPANTLIPTLSLVPTNTPLPTATLVPTPTDTVVLNQEEGATEEELVLIKEELEKGSRYVNHYYQGECRGEDFLLYNAFFERASGIFSIALTDLASGKVQYLSSDEYLWENSMIHIKGDYMQSLRSTYYHIQVEYVVKGMEGTTGLVTYLRIYPPEELFVEGDFPLQGNYMEYCYEEYETLHATVCPDTKARITGLCVGMVTQAPPEQYRILYDGRGIELSGELLEQCKNQQETVFNVVFDDGRKEELTIANPYVR